MGYNDSGVKIQQNKADFLKLKILMAKKFLPFIFLANVLLITNWLIGVEQFFMDIKEQLLQEIESSTDVILAETLDFLRFIKTKTRSEEASLDSLPKDNCTDESSHFPSKERTTKPEKKEAMPIFKGSKAEDLLKFAGTWQGNDFGECLQLVYETRYQKVFEQSDSL